MQSSTFGVATEANWSYPLPLGNQIEQISPYINRVNGGNTFFGSIRNQFLQKGISGPDFNNLANTRYTLLPTDPSVTAQKYDSYTTQINVVDAYNAPVANATVKIGSTFRVPVYVNNHYYVLEPPQSTSPLTIKAVSPSSNGLKTQLVRASKCKPYRGVTFSASIPCRQV